jgi:hypothetical protein
MPTVEIVAEQTVEFIPPTPPPDTSRGVPPSCPNPAAQIVQPGDGASVTGVAQIIGSATVENFDYYKFEFKDPTTGEWVFVTRSDLPVSGGVMGSWNTDTVPPGTYSFQLVVVDQTGNFPPPCVIQLKRSVNTHRCGYV